MTKIRVVEGSEGPLSKQPECEYSLEEGGSSFLRSEGERGRGIEQRERVETSWLETEGKRVREREREREEGENDRRHSFTTVSAFWTVVSDSSSIMWRWILDHWLYASFFFCSSSLVVHFRSPDCVLFRRIWHTRLPYKFASSAPRLVFAHPLLRVPSILVLLSTFGVSRVAGKTGRIMVSEKMQAAKLLVIVSLWERVRSKRKRFAEEKEQNLASCDLVIWRI